MNMIEQLNISQPLIQKEAQSVTFTSKMILSDFHAQPQGFLNGGATLAFCEIVAGMASNQLGQGKYFAVGQTVTGHHLNPKKSEGFVKARGILLHQGSRSHVWEIKVLDENEKLISQVNVVNTIIYQ